MSKKCKRQQTSTPQDKTLASLASLTASKPGVDSAKEEIATILDRLEPFQQDIVTNWISNRNRSSDNHLKTESADVSRMRRN